MKIYNQETICLIHSPDLTALNYHDDLSIRDSFNSKLSKYLKSFLEESEKIYSLTGHGLLIRLKHSNEIRLSTLYQIVNAYVFTWDNRQIHFHCGISYITGKIDSIAATHLFIILSEKIHTSIKNDCPESVNVDGAMFWFIFTKINDP